MNSLRHREMGLSRGSRLTLSPTLLRQCGPELGGPYSREEERQRLSDLYPPARPAAQHLPAVRLIYHVAEKGDPSGLGELSRALKSRFPRCKPLSLRSYPLKPQQPPLSTLPLCLGCGFVSVPVTPQCFVFKYLFVCWVFVVACRESFFSCGLWALVPYWVNLGAA